MPGFLRSRYAPVGVLAALSAVFLLFQPVAVLGLVAVYVVGQLWFGAYAPDGKF